MDINIFWRVMKLIYHHSTAGVALRPALSGICPLFGLWHAYKQCINLTYKKFAPFFVPVEYDTYLSSPETIRAYAYPDLISKERLILGLYLGGYHVYHSVQHNRNSFTGTGEKTQWGRIWTALHSLLFEYVPALLHLGILLRDCTWEHTGFGTGHNAC